MTRHSPCVGICTLDDATGYCIGCGRTGEEVAQWITMSDPERNDVWLNLPSRLKSLGVRVRLLPWISDEILAWTARTIAERRGTWAVGSADIVAEFPSEASGKIEVDQAAGTVVARTSGSSFRLRIDNRIRAFVVDDDGPIVLGLPKKRAIIPSGASLEPLGPDADAIEERHRTDDLFDLGLGGKRSRFCIRAGALAGTLSEYVGRRWSHVAPMIRDRLVALNPNRIIETAIARIELLSPVPRPVPVASEARDRFLLPGAKSLEEITKGSTLPAYAAPVAVFCPNGTTA